MDEFVEISDEEGLDEMMIQNGRPPSTGNNNDTGSINLPTPPPFALPMGENEHHNLNGSSLDASSSSLSSRHSIPAMPPTNNHTDPLPMFFPQYNGGGGGVRTGSGAATDTFLNRINRGRQLRCLLCSEEKEEHHMLKHICERHFHGYRPFKCGECDYQTGSVEMLTVCHSVTHGHEDGATNYQIVAERNQNLEYVIQMMYAHVLKAHGDPSEDHREDILRRITIGARYMRNRRLGLPPDYQPPDDDDDFDFDEPLDGNNNDDDHISMPVLSPVMPTDPSGHEEHIIPPAPLSASSTSSMSSLSNRDSPSIMLDLPQQQGDDAPGPIRARKSIQNSRWAPMAPSSAAPAVLVPVDMNRHWSSAQGASASNNDSDQQLLRASVTPPSDTEQSDRCNANVSPPTTVVDPHHHHPTMDHVLMPPVSASPPVQSPQTSSRPSSQGGASGGGTPLTCDFCSLQPPHKLFLKPHCQKVHADGYAPYKCDQPGCTFADWAERHLRDHVIKKHDVKVTSKFSPTLPTQEQRAKLEILVNALRAKGIPVEDILKLLV